MAKIEQKNAHTSRESWMRAFYDAVTPYMDACGYKLPPNVRFNIGFTSHGRKGKKMAEVVFPEASADSHFELIVSSDIDDALEVAGQILHACGHILTGKKHSQDFRDYCLKVGLDVAAGGLRMAMPSARLKLERLHEMMTTMGPLPHARLDFDLIVNRIADRKPKQKARMLKAECRSPGCGYLVRVASTWLTSVGAPHCPKHGEMFTAQPPTAEAAE